MSDIPRIAAKPGRTVLIFAAACFILSLAACGESDTSRRPDRVSPQSSEDPAQRGGVYRVPLMQTPASLDPASVRDLYGEAVIHQVFDGLVQFGPYLTVLPALAESWQLDDNGRRIRFVIREEARFHNGRLVTAEDARYSLTRLLRVEPPPAILPHLLKIEGALAYRNHESEQVRGLQCPRERELVVRLTQPHAPFLSALAMYQASIVPVENVEGVHARFAEKPVGTGPFHFASWENRVISLKRYDWYFTGKAFMDEIQFHLYPGSRIDEVMVDFKRGQLEEMPHFLGVQENLTGDKAYRRVHRPSLSLFFYGINTRHPLLQHPEIRKALSLAIDRSVITSEVYNDQFEAAHSVLPPGMPAYQRLDDLTRFDLSAARESIRKFGPGSTTKGWELEIVSGSASDFAKKELEIIRRSWRPLGIELKTKFISEWSQFERYVQSDAVQLYRYAWNADLPDPDSFFHPLFASDSPVNFGRFTDARADRMISEALAIVEPVERASKYQQIERYILNQYPIIPMFYLSIDRIYQPYVEKVHINALGAHTMVLNRVWFNKESGKQASD